MPNNDLPKSVSAGHPSGLAEQISDAVLHAILRKDVAAVWHARR
jgi:S-adenosylmethionine synthetase